MTYLQDIPHLREDLIALSQDDPLFAPHGINIDHLPWEKFEPGFEGLTRTLQSQQISVKVADVLWFRLKDLAGGTVTPEFFLSLDEPTLRNTGFTRQKAHYMTGLCQAIHGGEFDPDEWGHLNDKEIISKIKALKGFGPWSAHTFMLFSLARRDILPAKDLILDRAMKNLFALCEIPSYEQACHLCNRWAGKRTAATLLMWQMQVEQYFTQPRPSV